MLDLGAGARDAQSRRQQGVSKAPRLSAKFQNDYALLIGQRRVIAASLEEAIGEVFRLRIKPRRDYGELEALHCHCPCLQRPTARMMSLACASGTRGVDHTKIVHPSR